MDKIIRDITQSRHQPMSPTPSTGDKVNVHVRIKEGGKERIQIFQGVVIKTEGKNQSFTVRKISEGIGVEKTFPLNSPVLSKIEILSQSKVRRAKLYYIRKLQGRASRLTSIFASQIKEGASKAQDAKTVEPSSDEQEDSPQSKASSKE